LVVILFQPTTQPHPQTRTQIPFWFADATSIPLLTFMLHRCSSLPTHSRTQYFTATQTIFSRLARNTNDVGPVCRSCGITQGGNATRKRSWFDVTGCIASYHVVKNMCSGRQFSYPTSTHTLSSSLYPSFWLEIHRCHVGCLLAKISTTGSRGQEWEQVVVQRLDIQPAWQLYTLVESQDYAWEAVDQDTMCAMLMLIRTARG
jgi:hypothetical protein